MSFRSVMKKWKFLTPALILVSAAVAMAGDRPMIEVTPGAVSFGPQMGYGQCPCFRWAIHVETVSGTIETKEILISVNSLFEMDQKEMLHFQQASSRLWKFGSLEALLKGAHVGIGFNGITIGTDVDRSYSDILRTGAYLLWNAIHTEVTRLDIRSGYEFQRMSVNMAPQMTDHVLPQTAILEWDTGKWSGEIKASVGFRPTGFSETNFGMEASAHLPIYRFRDVALGLAFNFSAEHDGLRKSLGLAPNQFIGSILMDVSWVDPITVMQGTNL